MTCLILEVPSFESNSYKLIYNLFDKTKKTKKDDTTSQFFYEIVYYYKESSSFFVRKKSTIDGLQIKKILSNVPDFFF